MKIIKNNGDYITKETLDQCFEVGVFHAVDKVKCGNGFSTSFIMDEVADGDLHLMIVPNKGVLAQKEQAYRDGTLKTPNYVTFMYADTDDRTFEYSNFVMLIADTFVLKRDYFYNKRHRIKRILLDEMHSIEQQSTFRPILRGLMTIIRRTFVEISAVTSVTASPNLGSEITIRIENKYVPPVIWNYTTDGDLVVEEIREIIKRGEKVIIATNNKHLILSARSNLKKKQLDGKLIVGKTLIGRLASFVKINPNNENLIIMSSRGFEGHDISGDDWHFYFLEDRSYEHSTHFISNIYQASNRARSGCKRITYCRANRGHDRRIPTKEEIIKFIEDKSKSTASKLNKDNLKPYKQYINVSKKNDTLTIELDETRLNLAIEKRKFDAGFMEFEQFLSDRNIKLNMVNMEQKRIKRFRQNKETKIQMLYDNREYLRLNDVFGEDHTTEPQEFEDLIHAREYFDNWLVEKNYDGNYVMTERNKIANYLLFEDDINARINNLVKLYSEYHRSKNSPAVAKKKIELFKNRVYSLYLQMIMIFNNEVINVPLNPVGYRDYNILTQVSENIIRSIAEVFKLQVTIIDIRNAYPRICYALYGDKGLPDDFYGKNKKNKIKINIHLNSYHYNEKAKTPKKIQKQNAWQKLHRLGFDEEVAKKTVDTWFESEFKSDFFNEMAKHEENIILDLRSKIYKDGSDYFLARRHDSLVIFGTPPDLKFLPEFEYLGQYGWFEVPEGYSNSAADYDDYCPF